MRTKGRALSLCGVDLLFGGFPAVGHLGLQRGARALAEQRAVVGMLDRAFGIGTRPALFEEVVQLAGVSVDYYTRLDQGRLTSASEGVILSIAEALQLAKPRPNTCATYCARSPAAARKWRRPSRSGSHITEATRSRIARS